MADGVAAERSKGAPFLGRRHRETRADKEAVEKIRRRRGGSSKATDTAEIVVETRAAALAIMAVCQGHASKVVSGQDES